MSNLINFTFFKIEKVIKLYRACVAGGIVGASKDRIRAENRAETLWNFQRSLRRQNSHTQTIPLVTQAIKIDLSVVS